MAIIFVRLGTVRAFLLAFSALVATSSLRAQISSADILGNAFDPSGAALVGVKISVTHSQRVLHARRRAAIGNLSVFDAPDRPL